ncbi:MAG: SAM-dependent methyltransferase TehB [Tatlockia sp.]|nr:SAM-dependent methyltransferase TehB [Tatlockia sp.]
MFELDDDLLGYKQIEICTEGKLSFFLEKHSTKEGTWGKLLLNSGEIDFIFLDGEERELSQHRMNESAPLQLIPPASWHKIVPVSKKFNASLTFYCKPHRYFNKKYGVGNVHSDLLYIYKNYFQNHRKLNILDLGCGSGRNLLFLALAGHRLTGVDINEGSIQHIQQIAQQENMVNITTRVHDLNQPLLLKKETYDFVISTVSLQFLQTNRIPSLIKEMQQLTRLQGLHLLVFPINEAKFNLPPSFTFLPESKELYNNYQNSGWSILEYKESIGQLHKSDALDKPIQGLFGLLLAQKMH